VIRRLVALGGLLFPVCFVAAALTYGSGAGKTAPEIAAYYASAAHADRQLAGFALMLVAAAALLVFAAGLGGRLMLSAGTAAAVLLALANALWASSALAARTEPSYTVPPAAHLLVEDAGFACFVSAMVAAAVCVAAASRCRELPRLLALAGIPVAVALLAAYWYVPAFAFLVWTAAVGAAALRGGKGSAIPVTSP
jgi:hypothetical protein